MRNIQDELRAYYCGRPMFRTQYVNRVLNDLKIDPYYHVDNNQTVVSDHPVISRLEVSELNPMALHNLRISLV